MTFRAKTDDYWIHNNGHFMSKSVLDNKTIDRFQFIGIKADKSSLKIRQRGVTLVNYDNALMLYSSSDREQCTQTWS